ncbi:TetR/AcrR family transcriptional regulator [Nocardioides sp. JQ2195]|uniref:TetR/AcrR family transcriptional regulator n=1 Tax=Nocardioides sp. JQ2195 TaxID=2592334 RepID=UPI00143EBBC7|nr:TetR/AcrR family transcriptional regulator [Nocardioides sp. JQ2195]QIX27227.1 TetR/AcrR family transcriptional regulator [Nocardioides sp. JQ2195]
MGRSRRLGTQTSVPSQREDQKALTRARLIEASLVVFHTEGYAAATINDIVAEAGVSRATFYLHFASKLDVIVAIRVPIVQSTSELSELLPGAVSRGPAGMSEWLDLALDRWESFAPAFWAIQQADQIERELPEEISTIRDDTVRGIIQGLGSGSALTEAEKQVRARAAWGLLHDLFDHYATDGWVHGRPTVHKALLDAWVALLT